MLARALLGACIAGVPAAAMAHLGEELPGHVRARVMGLYIAANALGGMAGRLLSAVVTDFSGSWQIGLAVLGGIGPLVAPSSGACCRRPAISNRARCNPACCWPTSAASTPTPACPGCSTTAFLSMGAFVGLCNHLPFRLVQAPFTVSGRRRSAASSCSTRWAAIPRPGPGARCRHGRPRILLGMALLAALGIGATLADALWLIIAGLGIFTFGFFAVHSVASAWVGHRAEPRRGLVSALYLASYYLGGSLLGTAAGWAWSHGGWPGCWRRCLPAPGW